MTPCINPPQMLRSRNRGLPSRTGWCFTALLACVVFGGCRCCPWTEHYADEIDHVSNHECELDGLYCESLDLTRIDRPGGLSCRGCNPGENCYVPTTVYANRWKSPPMTSLPSSAGEQ